MAELRYPRFNTIYSDREQALNKLNELTRSYGEPVAIRYYNSKREVCLVVAVYKSDGRGDYSISYDSNADLIPNAITITKTEISQTDEDCITAALFGKSPVPSDIVIITDMTVDTPITRSYIYVSSGSWKNLTSGSSSEIEGAVGSLVLGDSVSTGVNEDGNKTLEVKVDGSSLVYDENIGGITVKHLNGGTF